MTLNFLKKSRYLFGPPDFPCRVKQIFVMNSTFPLAISAFSSARTLTVASADTKKIKGFQFISFPDLSCARKPLAPLFLLQSQAAAAALERELL